MRARIQVFRKTTERHGVNYFPQWCIWAVWLIFMIIYRFVEAVRSSTRGAIKGTQVYPASSAFHIQIFSSATECSLAIKISPNRDVDFPSSRARGLPDGDRCLRSLM